MNIARAKHLIVLGLRRFGVVATSLGSSPDGRIGKLLRFYEISTVLDVGANIGQYGRMLRRELGFVGEILSFEPMSPEFQRLQQVTRGDSRWRAFNFGFGDRTSSMTINVAANSASSSLLKRTHRLSRVAPETEFVGKQEVQLRTVDDVYEEFGLSDQRVYLKIDAQGFEGKILKGAERALGKIDAVQIEMPLQATYEGALRFEEILQLLMEREYRLVHLVPGLFDKKTGELLECDGIFYRHAGEAGI